MALEKKFRICPLCEAGCGLEITIENEKIVKVSGDKNYPPSLGYICPKGASFKKFHEDEDILKKPLIKKDGKFYETSFDEAFSYIENRFSETIKKHGYKSLSAYLGNPNTHTMAGGLFLGPLLKSLKSPNLFTASTVDQMPKLSSCGFLYGHPMRVPVPDIDNTDLFVVLGANPLVSNGSLMTAPNMKKRIKDLKERGGKMIVIDPFKSKTAEYADKYLQINPGTDVFLLFAMVNYLFENDLISITNEDNLFKNLDKLKKTASDFDLESAEAITSIKKDEIVNLALEIRNTKKCAVYGRMGTSTVEFGTLTSWLIEIVNIISGNFDKKGGTIFSRAPHIPDNSIPAKGFKIHRFKSRVSGYGEVMGELPVAAMAEEMDTPGKDQIKALITVAGNPVISVPESERLDKALSKLDFMVSVDYYINETTRHADVILPPAQIFCHGHFDFFFHSLAVRNFAAYSPPILNKKDDQMDKWEILAKLILILKGNKSSVSPLKLEDMMLNQIASGVIKGLGGEEKAKISNKDLIGMLNGEKGPERILDFLLRIGPYGDNFGLKPDGVNLKKIYENNYYIDLGPLKPWAKHALLTPDSKIDLIPDVFETFIEQLKNRKNIQKIMAKDCFYLIGRRNLRSNNSWMHNIDTLSKNNKCTIFMNPYDADENDIKDNEIVIVKTDKSEIEIPVEITKKIKPGIISIPHGFGHDLKGIKMDVASKNPGVNVNRIIPFKVDPLSGTTVLNGVKVLIKKR